MAVQGEVVIKGHVRQGLLSDDDTSESLKVGLVFQSGALIDSLTVGENVGFLLHEHTKLPKEKIQAGCPGCRKPFLRCRGQRRVWSLALSAEWGLKWESW